MTEPVISPSSAENLGGAVLLERLYDHLEDGGLVGGYAVRYFRWTDQDIGGQIPFILFRLAGSQGALTDFSVQYIDVQMILVDIPANTLEASQRCWDIMRYVRSDYAADGTLYVDTLAPPAGPFYFENGRPWFQMEFRLLVSDH